MGISFHSDNNARLSVDFTSVRQALKLLKSSEANATPPLKIGRIILQYTNMTGSNLVWKYEIAC